MSSRGARPAAPGRVAKARCDNRAAHQAGAAPACPLATDKELSDFLKSVEKRAFKRAVYAVRDDDAALDIVQDTMIRLAEKYADRPAAELPLLFQRILSNARWTGSAARRCATPWCATSRTSRARGDDGDFDLLETLEALDGSLGTESAADTVVAGADPAT